jgi:N-methylhydantoinase A
VVLDGELRYAGVFEVEWGIPIAIPTIDVTTIGAGGSSIASIDYGGLLRVGPESAGAAPGPASYGLGGDKPTITDANVVLGRLDPAYFLGGQMALDATRAADVIDDLARALGVERPDAAKAVVDVAIENMAGAVRLVTVDRGLDYRDFDLVAFGGAGPLHAVDMADRLGMRRVIVPPNPGLVSAYGAVIADERVDRRATLIRRLDGAAEQDLVARLTDVVNHAVKELNRHRRDLSLPAEVSAYVACRYIGQNYEQEILVHRGTSMSGGEFMGTGASSGPPLVEGLVAAFHDRHREVYGYDMQDQAIESVYVAATALARAPAVRADPYGRPAEQEPPRHRSVFAGTAGWVDALVVRRAALKPGAVITGPAIIEEADSTTWVPQRHHAKVHSSWCLIVEATAAPQGER